MPRKSFDPLLMLPSPAAIRQRLTETLALAERLRVLLELAERLRLADTAGDREKADAHSQNSETKPH